ncbi:GNAT family N-acetyltransferase [Vibrio ulleungensis]|uniref:tRNA(Met) cytidine acetyltransferase TmcA n=1 Tax=Vibrio ulleungensis TaxID=2807619 RepID=A0ABS2HFT0_9VIBR|nr:GNAT family N-acetyltransferase [Vibrio ulleungensis]MBM7034937.1 tRNA(Met) cytidine acetyltransferase [Vibrio ulleungensis]
MTLIAQELQRIVSLHQQAANIGHRAVVVLKGPTEWATEIVRTYYDSILDSRTVDAIAVAWEPLPFRRHVMFKQARTLLGSECQFLAISLDQPFDANGFNAAIGCLAGNGLLVLSIQDEPSSHSMKWLSAALDRLPTIFFDENRTSPVCASAQDLFSEIHYSRYQCDTTEQEHIVPALGKVVTGHRKRPLVVTADRGRGKSSGIGLALAKLLQKQRCQVIVTAPRRAAVEPLFQYAAENLGISASAKLEYQGSSIRFIAPDELIETQPFADLVIVDEASALPLPILTTIAEHYHRLVFSSTIHGYEGCGRGFSLKFMQWLDNHRKGWQQLHLENPMRWAPRDPLEYWLNQTFLLSAEPDTIESVNKLELCYNTIDKPELLNNSSLLSSCVGLLVNAHYQTSPNDIFTLLDDDAISLNVATIRDSVVGVLLTVDEGGVSQDVVADVQAGQRRPKGHLVAANLANHLGEQLALSLPSCRVMRIAVHPSWQKHGVGQYLLEQLIDRKKSEVEFISTSFGVTQDLVCFWEHCGFRFVKMGVSKDNSSGTYSGIWLYSLKPMEWITQALSVSRSQLLDQLSHETKALDSELALILLSSFDTLQIPNNDVHMMKLFGQGGNSIASVRSSVMEGLRSDPSALQTIELRTLLIDVFIKNVSTEQLVKRYPVTGSRQIEQRLRDTVSEWMNLHCKLTLDS